MALEQAKEFLARVIPWPTSEEPGYVNVIWSQPNTKDPTKKFWGGRACVTMADAERALSLALNDPKVLDIYACMSKQSMMKPRKSKKGYEYREVVRSQENAVSLKSFYLDVDVRPDNPAKNYTTFEEAATAIFKFISDVGLPAPSIIIHSGGGFQVYWTVDRALT